MLSFSFSLLICKEYYFSKQQENDFVDDAITFINQQWLSNRKLLDKLEIFKIDPRLKLYSKVDFEFIQNCEKCEEELRLSLDQNKRYQQQFGSLSDFSFIKEELELQNLQLLIGKTLTTALKFRSQLYFFNALEEINKALELIQIFEIKIKENSIPGYKTPNEFYTIAYYSKGKIHRMLAGMDLENLNLKQLQESEKSYLAAIQFSSKDANIHSSLGFLYIDMGLFEEALECLKLANILNPNCSVFIHGIAYCYYKIEKQKSELGEPLDKTVLALASDTFERAILLFSDSQPENSRIFLDRGLLKILMEQPEEALKSFNYGLQLEPLHSLLLLERGLLLSSLGQYQASLKDLRLGFIISRDDLSLSKKYEAAIYQVVLEGNDSAINKIDLADNKDDQQYSIKRSKFENFLKACNAYITKKNKKKPTCFISYAWDILEHEKWVELFAEDLEKAGFQVLLDRWLTRKGEETMDFIEKILDEDTDYIIVIGTNLYLKKYNNKALDKDHREKFVKVEGRILNHLIGYSQEKSDKIIPILIEGTEETSLPPLLRMKNTANFITHDYFEQMIELIRDLYGIDQRDPVFKKMTEQFE